MAKGVISSDDAFERTKKAVRHFEGTYRNPGKRGVKKMRPRSGTCPARDEIHSIHLQGPPTSGNLVLVQTVLGTTENITIAYNATASEVKTAYEGHAEIEEDDVIVTGGPLPGASIQVKFVENLAGKLVPVPLTNITGLSGTGRGAIVIRLERGLPGDATNAEV